MNVEVASEYAVKRIDNGLGGLILEERPVTFYIKDLSKYEKAIEYEKNFDKNIVNIIPYQRRFR